VDWGAVQHFLALLDETGRRGDGLWRFRLPTEAEWEYAARATTVTAFHFGHTITAEQANFNGERPYPLAGRGPNRECTVPVRQFEPNSFGLYQMLGNVWEWCADAYVKDLGESEAVDPYLAGDARSARTVRGGSWICPAHGARSAFRSFDAPTDRYDNLGFRIAFGPELSVCGAAATDGTAR
jgi:formylglycine-generating enzyme required for sulfatase activity